MDRDLLRHGLRLLLLIVRDQATLGWIRAEAPDLAAMTDLVFRVEPVADEVDWPTVARQIQSWSQSKNRWIDLSALSNKQGDRIRLDELYHGLVRIRWTSKVHQWTNEEGQKRPALSLFLAPPGSGKTTFLRQTVATPTEPVAESVRILVPLPSYAEHCRRQGSITLLDYLPLYLASEGINAGRLLTDNLSKVSLLLDGLDEVPGSGLRTTILHEVADAVEASRLRSCVVAGRATVLAPLPRALVDRFAQVQAQPLTDDQRRTYLQKWTQIRAWEPERWHRLEKLITVDTSLEELSRRPLTLMLLALAFERSDELPRHRVHIYEAVNAMLVARWRRARSMVGSTAPAIDPSKVLGPLAQRILWAGGVVHVTQLRSWLKELEGLYAPAPTAEAYADRLIALLETDAAVLSPLAKGIWSFAHPTLAEHLAAQGILQDATAWEALLNHPFEPQKREVLLFAAATLAWRGEGKRLRDLLQAVLARSKRKGQYSLSYPSLLLGLLQDQLPGAHDFEAPLVDRLLPLWLEARYSPEVAHQVYTEANGFLEWAQHTEMRHLFIAALPHWLAEPRQSEWWNKNFADTGEANGWTYAFTKALPASLTFANTLASFAAREGLPCESLIQKIQIEQVAIDRIERVFQSQLTSTVPAQP
jgi:hypothetical protein